MLQEAPGVCRRRRSRACRNPVAHPAYLDLHRRWVRNKRVVQRCPEVAIVELEAM